VRVRALDITHYCQHFIELFRVEGVVHVVVKQVENELKLDGDGLFGTKNG